MLRLSTNTITRHLSKGFTLPELIIVITVSGLLIGLLFGPLDSLYTNNSTGLKSVVQTVDTRGALRQIEHGITLSLSFYDSNWVGDPLGQHNNGDNTQWTWAGSGSTSRVLITGNYATTIDEAQDSLGARTLVYYGAGCTTPIVNNVIYFVSSGTLYRRTIKNTTSPCSGSVAQLQSCAAGVSNGACQAVDAKILTGVTNFSIDYYLTPDAASPMANEYTDITVPGTAKTIVINLTAATGTGNSAVSSSSSLRITRLNGVTL